MLEVHSDSPPASALGIRIVQYQNEVHVVEDNKIED